MSRFAKINLSELPAPDVIETLDYDVVLNDAITRLVELMPEVEEALALESEPLRKLLELLSYVVLLLRARINDAARGAMLATATGADLENLAALFGTSRLLIAEATEDAAAIYEDDDALRARTQLAPEAYTTAGSVGAYEYHARSASPLVRDVSVTSPQPGSVLVTILSTDEAGMPTDALLETVHGALNAEEVRPLCDDVIVSAPMIVTYAVAATLEIASGPDRDLVLARARRKLTAYLDSVHMLGGTVAVSGIMAALHQAGVTRVVLTSPIADIETDVTAAPLCSGSTISATEAA
ncbi:MAG: baseplate J/gp47 family protein [Paenirhodobacter sp.]|uniref:baseplate assembly protein n=1 Tax=Paenirhodobacter sp. TaxID=1965326 RepID=UPI003D14BC35